MFSLPNMEETQFLGEDIRLIHPFPQRKRSMTPSRQTLAVAEKFRVWAYLEAAPIRYRTTKSRGVRARSGKKKDGPKEKPKSIGCRP
jgi:hypothetical protein